MHLRPLTDIPNLVALANAMVANDPVELIPDIDHLTDVSSSCIESVNDETLDPGFDIFNLSDDNKNVFDSHKKNTLLK